MLSYTTLPRHKPRRKLKKYQHYCVRKDKDFRGPRVYVYGSFSVCVCSRQNRDGRVRPVFLSNWLCG